MKKIRVIASMVVTLGTASGCATVPDGYADSFAGRAAAAETCRSAREFVRAPLDDSGLRRAWFLPFGSSGDGSIDFYAPMASEPSDAASKKFYWNKVGQLTHYLRAPEFAESLANCLTRRAGFERAGESRTGESFRASFTELRSGRSIEIRATADRSVFLIADRRWNGDLEVALAYEP